MLMKKVMYAIILLLIPFLVKAMDNYEITDYLISSEVEIAGGIKVKELIVLDGNVDTFQRKIEYKDSKLEKWYPKKIDFSRSSIYNANGIENLKVAIIDINGNVDFSSMDKIEQYATLIENEEAIVDNTYTISETDNGVDVDMYLSSNNQKKGLYLEYVVTNAIVIHNDVAELYYHYIPKSFEQKIKNFSLRAFIPQPDNSDTFQVWAHAEATGEVKKYTNSNKENIGVLVELKNVEKNSGFDLRMTFNKEMIMIDNFLNKSDESALKEIAKVENRRSKNTSKSNLLKFIFMVLIAGYIILMIIIGVIFYKKKKRKNR